MSDGRGRSTDGSDVTPGRGTDDQTATCENCDGVIETSEWFPVTAQRDADGDLQIHQFCCERCRDEWAE